MPKISVIVPIYNCAAYLERCLDSLAAQTFTDIEFILINDGSTDGGEAILRRYAQADRRFVLISQENQGLPGARNTGLDAATGDYLGFVDADDFVEPDMYEALLTRLLETGSDVAICDYVNTYRNRESAAILALKDEVIDVSSLGLNTFYLRYIAHSTPIWNKLYQRKIITDCALRFERDYTEDMLFNLRIVPLISRLCTVSKPLYHYVQRCASISHSKTCDHSQASLLSFYIHGVHPDSTSNLMSHFAFALLFMGFMFSGYCVKQDLAFFQAQIKLLRTWPLFQSFCEALVTTDTLQPLYLEKAISIRFYWIERIAFYLCLHHHDGLSAAFLCVCSKLIVFKKRILVRDQFD